MKFTALRLSATASTFALSAAFASPAFAQTPSTSPGDQQIDCTLPANSTLPACASEVARETGKAPTNEQSIVVTGSRIRRPNLESPVPITSLSNEELTMTGEVNVGDRLNDLPALRTTFSQANSTRFIGTSGLNILDLRGLGTSRTLVLVNGRRHVTSSPGDFLVDTNTIPTDLIERVDVVTGGSSAVYGSDAVAGVVNFILKKSYDGIKLRAQSGISSRGDRPINFVSLTAGRNFFDGRANVAANLEFVDAGALYLRDRPALTGAFSGRCQFNATSFAAGEPATGNGVPDQTFICGVRNANISEGGQLSGLLGQGSITSARVCQGLANPRGLTLAQLQARCLNFGTPQGQPRIFFFQPNGTLCEDVPALDFRPFASGNYIHDPNSTCQGGSTLRLTGQLAPSLRRYTGNILAHYDISDALQPFIEAKYVHIYSHQEFQPTFSTGGLTTFACTNPFLTAQALAQLQAIGRCTNPATGFFSTARFNVDLGGRVENDTRKTYRIVGGIQGDFNEDWHYEVSGNYGHFKQNGRNLNDLLITDVNGNPAGYLLAIDAVRNSSGQIVCGVNADADPTNDAPGCVPIDLFGNGAVSTAARNFVNYTSTLDQKAAEYDGLAYLSGDTSQAFNLPGGPLRFVVGGEWRKETASFKADPVSAANGTFFNAFAPFNPPSLVSKELFGELEQTVFKDVPGIEELTVTGAGRYSWYNKGAGETKHTFAWNANAIYSPVRDLRLRGNYSKSVRVPTLTDLFTNPTQDFAQLQDPCDFPSGRIGPVGGTRYNNCLALGVPVGFTATFSNAQTSSIIDQGTPTLKAEVGKSWTLGGVATPRWVPGLSLSVDYYHINVEKEISVLTGQSILNLCVDLPTINNQFCDLIFPRDATGALAQPALISQPLNFAKFKAYGIDFELAYRHTFGNGHRLNFHGVATRSLNRTNYTDPTNPTFPDRILSELGDPKWAANANIGYGIGRFDINYTLNYIGKQTIGAYENYFHVPGNPSSPTNADFTAQIFYPDALYHGARVDYKLPYAGKRAFDFYLGADNIFDKEPPFGLLGTEGGTAYDAIGRYLDGGVNIDF